MFEGEDERGGGERDLLGGRVSNVTVLDWAPRPFLFQAVTNTEYCMLVTRVVSMKEVELLLVDRI